MVITHSSKALYYISGLTYSCSLCLGDALTTTYQKWAPGQPTNTEIWDCVYMDAPYKGMVMSDCVNELKSTVCEI